MTELKECFYSPYLDLDPPAALSGPRMTPATLLANKIGDELLKPP